MNKFLDGLATLMCWLAGIFTVGVFSFFLGYVLWKGLPVLQLDFLLGEPREITAGGGVGPYLFNTLYLVLLSMVFSVPVGLGAGIYLSEYSGTNICSNIVRLSMESLSAVPTIVLGLFGFILFANIMGWGFSIIGGALALTLLNTPMLVNVTEKALGNVPKSSRKAGAALGATKWQTVGLVVLPSAFPELLTGFVQVTIRALGEAAILIYTAGVSAGRLFGDADLLGPGATLAVHLWHLNSESIIPDRVAIANGIAALLVILVFLFNLFTWLVGRRIRGNMGKEKWQGR